MGHDLVVPFCPGKTRGRVVEGLRSNALMSRLHTTLGSDARSIEFRRGRCG